MKKLPLETIRFAVKWIERKYFNGQPFLDALSQVKGYCGLNDPVGDCLETAMRNSDDRARIAKLRYKRLAERVPTAESAIMRADLDHRPTWGLFQRLIRVQNSANRARRDFYRTQTDALETTRRYSGYCQGRLL